MKKITISTLILCTAFAAAFGEPQDETQNPPPPPSASSFFVDPRDGKKYRTVKIGKQTWMAYNLNYKTGKSWCYDDDNSYCKKYGRLYDWNTAMKACPDGWRLPSNGDWNSLAQAVGGNEGTKLKSKVGWNRDGNGIDAYGFSSLPGGCRECGGIIGYGGNWWTSTEYGSHRALYVNLDFGATFLSGEDLGKGTGFSVRCLKN